MNELPVDFRFTEVEKKSLRNILMTINENPYTNYSKFESAVGDVLNNGGAPDSFVEFCGLQREVDTLEQPCVFLQNCPIDEDLPCLNFDDPVVDKRKRKTTYVAEGFLLIYAKLMRQEPIGYANVNDGDIFQDIHPKRDLVNSQSQKALKPIYFHKDLANHFVRPDWVNILGLRSSPVNEVYTSFVRNKDLLKKLDKVTLEVLRRPEFHTPFDDLTMYKSVVQLDRADVHPILGGATPTDIRFFENRTEGLTNEARLAVSHLLEILHRLKKRVLIQPGDLLGSANNDSMHNKEIDVIRDQRELEMRWLMKTVNVRSLHEHHSHFIEGRPRIVNG